LLTQSEADRLVKMKKIIESELVVIPAPGDRLNINAHSEDGKEHFAIDIYRGRIDIKKCNMQNIYRKTIPLMSLHIVHENYKHINPDGTVVVGPHLHIYKENYGTRFAIPYNVVDNLPENVVKFFKECNIINIPYIQGRIG